MNKKYIYLASFKWPGYDEALCAGYNKKELRKLAKQIAIERYGNGLVDRGSACCSCKITLDDIRIQKIILLNNRG